MVLLDTAHAQTFSKVASNPTISSLFAKISQNIISPAVGVLFIVAFLVFIWGVVSMIIHASDATARKDGQNSVLWGVVGMVIMLSVYGIIRLIGNTVGVGDPFQ